MEKKGVKFDENKLRYDLVPVDAMKEFVAVLTHGAAKYSPDNWKLVPNLQDRYYAAALRHLEAFRSGEIIDNESGNSHLAHAICCLFFKLQNQIENDKQNEKKRFQYQAEVFPNSNASINTGCPTLHKGSREVRARQLEGSIYNESPEGKGFTTPPCVSTS